MVKKKHIQKLNNFPREFHPHWYMLYKLNPLIFLLVWLSDMTAMFSFYRLFKDTLEKKCQEAGLST